MTIQLHHHNKQVRIVPGEGESEHRLSMPALAPRGDKPGWVDYFGGDRNLRIGGFPVTVTVAALARQKPDENEVAFIDIRGPKLEPVFALESVFGADRLFHAVSWHTDKDGRLRSVTGEYPMHNACTGAGYATAIRKDSGEWEITKDYDQRNKKSAA